MTSQTRLFISPVLQDWFLFRLRLLSSTSFLNRAPPRRRSKASGLPVPFLVGAVQGRRYGQHRHRISGPSTPGYWARPGLPT